MGYHAQLKLIMILISYIAAIFLYILNVYNTYKLRELSRKIKFLEVEAERNKIMARKAMDQVVDYKIEEHTKAWHEAGHTIVNTPLGYGVIESYDGDGRVSVRFGMTGNKELDGPLSSFKLTDIKEINLNTK